MPLSDEQRIAFVEQAREAMARYALPLFEEAARYGHEHEVQADVQSALADDVPELGLVLGGTAGYHIRLNDLQDRLLIQESRDNVQEPPREVAVTGINTTVIETDLASFFLRAAGLRLKYLEKRHPAGF